MTESAAERTAARAPVTRDRAVRVAVALADAGGIRSLSMRKLAAKLGIEAMSLYYHVKSKEDILNGMVDVVFGEIELPVAGEDWRTAMRRRAISARAALMRHPWATTMLEAGTTPGPATLRQHDSVIGVLRTAGFSVALAAHAFSLLDSYVYGFVSQENALPFSTPEESSEVTRSIMSRFAAEEYPHLTEMAVEYILRPGYDHGGEFEFGLDLILDALEQRLPARTD